MSKFNSIKARIEDPSILGKISDEDIFAVKKSYPQIPDDYLEFLKEVGSGNLGILFIYSSPMKPTEVYTTAREAELSGFALFADDMQGFCYAFDTTANYRVVEIDPRGRVDITVESDFTGFLESLFCG